jgi:hypothetical protein
MDVQRYFAAEELITFHAWMTFCAQFILRGALLRMFLIFIRVACSKVAELAYNYFMIVPHVIANILNFFVAFFALNKQTILL